MVHINRVLLKVVSGCLFGKGNYDVSQININRLLSEAKAQAVFPLVFTVVHKRIKIVDNSFSTQSNEEDDATDGLTVDQYQQYNDLYLQISVANYQNFSEHGELHELMIANHISYVAMKGLASAMYYPETSLRSMGDVDFLVYPKDLEDAGQLLESAGFAIDHGEKEESKHIAYHRPPMSIWKMHRNVNGVPGGKVGERIQAEINKTIDTAIEVNVDGIVCRVPDKFHHGLIMLLHTASHLTSEGVGLRHLCDWVVFASSMRDDEFRELFEVKLKDFGLWRFAQALTLLGITYLSAPERSWAAEAIENNSLTSEQLERLMEDILASGNFGKKDANRYREIKYISDRGKHIVSSDSIIRQGFKTMNSKVYADYRMIERHRILLPFGYIAEGVRYIGLLLTGKRKSSGTREMLKEAAERKSLYASLELFKG